MSCRACCAFCCDTFAYLFCDGADVNSALAALGMVVISGILVVVMVVAASGKDRVIRNDALALGKPMRQHASAPQLVDVVYTWVNGSQPEFQHTLLRAASEGSLPYRPHASRYRDDGLLQYSLRSLFQSDALMSRVRHVYIVSSGEVPSFLPAHEFRPVESAAASSVDPTCGAAAGFTRTSISIPLRPLVERSRRGRPARGGGESLLGGGEASRLFVVPHAAIFPEPEAELPTFNSNGILCSLHRLPDLSDWFVYSDDDTIITARNLSLNAWWDEARRGQRLYFTRGRGVHRRRRKMNNNWEEAMTYMSGLLDGVEPPEPSADTSPRPPLLTPAPAPAPATAPATATAPPPPSPPISSLCDPFASARLLHPSPAAPSASPSRSVGNQSAPSPSAAALGGGAKRSKRPKRSKRSLPLAENHRHKRGRMRYYSRPQHMPVLMSRALLYELESRWPAEFERTRQHRLRLGEELELNFFYNHYLRAQQFPVTPMESSHIEFMYAQECAGKKGEPRCTRVFTNPKVNFATFNDDATSRKDLEKGLTTLRKILRARYGTFD